MSLSRHDYQQWRTLVPSKSWPAKEDTASALLCTHKHIPICIPHTGPLPPRSASRWLAGWWLLGYCGVACLLLLHELCLLQQVGLLHVGSIHWPHHALACHTRVHASCGYASRHTPCPHRLQQLHLAHVHASELLLGQGTCGDGRHHTFDVSQPVYLVYYTLPDHQQVLHLIIIHAGWSWHIKP